MSPGLYHFFIRGMGRQREKLSIMEYNSNIMPPKPDNYLVWAILTTICCCLPFGIVSIVYAAKVNSLYTAQQYDLALEASRNAKKWAIIAAVSGIAISIIYMLIYAIWGIALFSMGNMSSMCDM
jgi:hypothetical protein